MVRLDHPTTPHTHVEVPEVDVDQWKAAGWVDPSDVSADKPSATTPAPRKRAAKHKE